MCGRYSLHSSLDEILDHDSFSIVVADANDLLRPIHNRMPVILNPSDCDAWLDVRHFGRTKLEALLRPYPPERKEAYAVSTWVNKPANDDEGCVLPLTGKG